MGIFNGPWFIFTNRFHCIIEFTFLEVKKLWFFVANEGRKFNLSYLTVRGGRERAIYRRRFNVNDICVAYEIGCLVDECRRKCFEWFSECEKINVKFRRNCVFYYLREILEKGDFHETSSRANYKSDYIVYVTESWVIYEGHPKNNFAHFHFWLLVTLGRWFLWKIFGYVTRPYNRNYKSRLSNGFVL